MTKGLNFPLLCFVGAGLTAAPLACGGAPSAGASTPGSTPGASSGGDAAQHCLAAASAKHERNPKEPARITVKHILVRYAGARSAPDSITRPREQACLRAEEALNKLKAGMSFGDAVAQYSDEPGAAARGGSIGAVERMDVAAPFADAAFELKPEEVSAVVETPFGFHLILRTE